MSTDLIVSFAVMLPLLLLSLSVHEMAHAWSADRLGDKTPRAAGRLTLNPLAHLDMWGTAALVVTFVVSQGAFFFGWARPVPIDPAQLARRRFGETLVSVSGPLSNFGLAILAGAMSWALSGVWPAAAAALALPFYLNMILAVLNILPVPPLDGWRALTGLLPLRHRASLERLAPYEQYVFLIFLALILLRRDLLGAVFGPPLDAAAAVFLPPVAR